MKILFAGGDARQAVAAQMLAHASLGSIQTLALSQFLPERLPEGLNPVTSLSEVAPFDVLVLPVPATLDGKTVHTVDWSGTPLLLSELLAKGESKGLVLAGQGSNELAEAFGAHGFEMVDYFRREELALANAVPTAEGAIQIAMEEMPITLHGAKVLLLGYGRLGQALAPRLMGLGAKVCVGARRLEQLALAAMHGADTVLLSETSAFDMAVEAADLVINTIPACVLTAEVLARTRPDALILDLASRPGGTDFSAAIQLGRQTGWELALPGKVAPKTAGRIISDTIRNILEERRGCGV